MKYNKIIPLCLFLFAFFPRISNAGEASNKFDHLVKEMELYCEHKYGCSFIGDLYYISYPVESDNDLDRFGHYYDLDVNNIIVNCEFNATRIYINNKALKGEEKSKSEAQREFDNCLKEKDYFNLKSEYEKKLKNYRKRYELAKEAHDLIDIAAKEGNEKAFYSYVLYQVRNKKNATEARDLFLMASKSNNIEISNEAHNHLARMYAYKVIERLSPPHVYGVLKRDVKKALYHLGQACNNGNSWSCEVYNELIDKGYSE